MIEYMNGTLGPKPDTITGLNRKEDLSVSLLHLERLEGLDAPKETPEEPETSFVVRGPDGDFSKPLSLKEALSKSSDLLSAAEGGDSVGIRKRQRDG